MSYFVTTLIIISYGYNRNTFLYEIIFFSNLSKIFRKKDFKFIDFSKKIDSLFTIMHIQLTKLTLKNSQNVAYFAQTCLDKVI